MSETFMPTNTAFSTLVQELKQPKHGGARNSKSADMQTVALRDIEAYRLHVCEGQTYQQIADKLGYADKGTVGKAVRRFLKDVVQQTANEMRAVAKERLDELFSVYFEKAKGGDIKAAIFCKSVLDSEAENFGYKQQPAQNEQDLEREAQNAAQQRAWAEEQLADLCRAFSAELGREVTPGEVLHQLSTEHKEVGAELAQSITDALGGGMTQSHAVN
jgi:hypothetical protein